MDNIVYFQVRIKILNEALQLP